MHYRTVAEAKNMSGLRLVLPKGVPAPWSESAKSIFHIKSIPYAAVAQYVGEENAELAAWTGFRNAPLALLDSERALDRWIDILMLAERMKPIPSLLPGTSDCRAMAIGISNEICGEWGFGWCRRLMLMGAMAAVPSVNITPSLGRLLAAYNYDPSVAATAPERVAEILTMLVNRLKVQKSDGSSYLVGDTLSVADVYWASFSTLIDPLPSSLSPMPEWQREMYNSSTPAIDAAKDPILFQHRDMIYARHLKLPVDC